MKSVKINKSNIKNNFKKYNKIIGAFLVDIFY